MTDDRVVLGMLLALAAILRLPGLESRGRFEYDQGDDMLTLDALVRTGVIPLLGPKASVGDFHHGALTFYLLAPGAWLSNVEPLGVTIEMALLGIAAVAATWWLGRVMGGPVVGAIAGFLLAVSPAAVDESVFIWNPNPIPLFAALALGAAWKGAVTGRTRWWVVALACAGVVAQLHVLGLILTVPIVGLGIVAARGAWIADGSPAERATVRRSHLRGIAAGLAIWAALFLPLVIHELTSGFTEARALIAYLAAGSAGAEPLLQRLLVISLRVIAWPFVGVLTDAPIAGAVVVAIVVGFLSWAALVGRDSSRPAIRWLGASIIWSVAALSVAAPTLANVVPGLPNDHYHAFVDPMLVVGVTLAGVAIGRSVVVAMSVARGRIAAMAPGAIAAALLLAVFLGQTGVALARQPVADPNGGWPAARTAGERIAATVHGAPVAVQNLPTFEPVGGIAFPFVHAGGHLTSGPPTYVVLGCDRLFESILEATCGGEAEAAAMPRLAATFAGSLALVDRFDVSPRVSISIYRVDPGG